MFTRWISRGDSHTSSETQRKGVIEIIAPMLAETAPKTLNLDDENYLYEQKLDGLRCIAFLDHETRLQSRSGRDITHKFPELQQMHKQVEKPSILDGEIVAKSFEALLHRIQREKPFSIKMAQPQYPVAIFLFDILHYAGNVEGKLLAGRKEVLDNCFAESSYARKLPYFPGKGSWLLDHAKENALEGIMAKRLDSPYIEGKRVSWWLKVKTFVEGEFYVCGVTEGEGSRADTFASLVLGELANGKLTFVGTVGSGFSQRSLKRFLEELEPLKTDACPLESVELDRPLKFWTLPKHQIEVRYLERTSEGKLRHPSYRPKIFSERG